MTGFYNIQFNVIVRTNYAVFCELKYKCGKVDTILSLSHFHWTKINSCY